MDGQTYQCHLCDLELIYDAALRRMRAFSHRDTNRRTGQFSSGAVERRFRPRRNHEDAEQE